MRSKKIDAMIQEILKEVEAQFVEEGKEWVSAQVDKEVEKWESKHPAPDEDEEGLHAFQVWEEDRAKVAYEAEEFYKEKFDTEILPARMEEYEMSDAFSSERERIEEQLSEEE